MSELFLTFVPFPVESKRFQVKIYRFGKYFWIFYFASKTGDTKAFWSKFIHIHKRAIMFRYNIWHSAHTHTNTLLQIVFEIRLNDTHILLERLRFYSDKWRNSTNVVDKSSIETISDLSDWSELGYFEIYQFTPSTAAYKAALHRSQIKWPRKKRNKKRRERERKTNQTLSYSLHIYSRLWITTYRFYACKFGSYVETRTDHPIRAYQRVYTRIEQSNSQNSGEWERMWEWKQLEWEREKRRLTVEIYVDRC